MQNFAGWGIIRVQNHIRPSRQENRVTEGVILSEPTCSIIIRSYNEGKHIGRLLTGIEQQTMRDVEVILVDSGSRDDTVRIAQEHGARVVQIAPEAFTFGRSLNLGIAVATGEFLVFASAHVYPIYPDWLEKLLEAFADPKIALVYGKQRGAETTKFSEDQIFKSWYPNETQPYQDTAFCNNANAAVRRRLVVEHPYDEGLPGLEDLAWGQWALDSGYKIHYAPEAEIAHVHEETPRGVYNRYRREAIAFKHLYIHERFGFLDFVRLSVRNILKDSKYALQEKVFLKSFASIVWFRVCQFWGTYQGYRHHGPLTWSLRQRFYYPNGVSEGNPPARRDEAEPIRYHTPD